MKKFEFKLNPLARRIGICAAFVGVAGVGQAASLEEVVVTAQKREQSLQDVPISVSAVSGEKIRDTGIGGFEELSAYIPNFSVSKDPIGDKINIRGIQSGNNAGFEQSVGTYVDGVYRGRGVQARFAFLDVGMVEVLRGPQGTLFGKNTIGGALNIRSAKPTDEREGLISATYNIEFEEADLEGFLAGPLSETMRGRVAFNVKQMDEGWVENEHYDSDIPETDEWFVRGSLEWDASDNTSVFFKVEKGDFDNEGQPFDLLTVGALSAFGLEGNRDFRTNMGNTDLLIGGNGDPVAPIDIGEVQAFAGDTDEVMVTVEHGFENGSTLTVIGAYSAYEFERFIDADFNPLPALRFDDTEDYDQTSLELRVASDVGGKIEYIAGGYYQTNDMYVDGLTQFNSVFLNSLLLGSCTGNGGVVAGDALSTLAANAAHPSAAVVRACALGSATTGLPGISRYHFLDQETDVWAIFSQVTWNITDTFRATVGLRYTEESKDAVQSVHATPYEARNTSEIPAGTDPLIDAGLLALGEAVAHRHELGRDEESFTWSLNVQKDLGADAMVYANASTGFKAGGFNSFAMSADADEADYDEEEVLAFEIGAKMGLLDGAAELNVAAFYTEFDDLQTSLFTGNTSFIVQNAAQAEVRGIEIDGRWQATDQLMIAGSFGWVDFEFKDFANAGCHVDQLLQLRQSQWDAGNIAAPLLSLQDCSLAAINDLSGEVSENTPEFAATMNLSYFQPIGKNYELNAAVDVVFQDDQFRQSDLDPFALEDAHVKVNATLTFGPVDGNWDVSLIGKNLTDETTISYLNDTPLFDGARQIALDPPASLALRGRLRF